MKKFIQFQGRYCNSDLFNIAENYDYKQLALLLSGSEYNSSKYSFLGLFPQEIVSMNFDEVKEHNPWNILKEKIVFNGSQDTFPEWIGYISYEMGAFTEESYKIPYYSSETPLFFFQKFAIVLQLEISTGIITAKVDSNFLDNHKKEFDKLENLLIKKNLLKTIINNNKIYKKYYTDDFNSYQKKIKIAKDHIFNGDIYQINLSQKFSFEGSFSPLNLYKILFNENPTPFSAFLYCLNFSIVSTSPERLLLKKESFLETRPIKGTMARGKTIDEDLKNKESLLTSLKNKSELLMITDLMRNDLSKISQKGSVTTDEIWKCEAYKNVFHLLSLIQSKISDHIQPIDAVKKVFPGGSITGCPKIRSMEIIYEIEKDFRGIYTGSIGYFTEGGDFDFNIAIRTLHVQENHLTLRLGGAIMAESCPLEEYNETLVKGESIFKCLENYKSNHL